jgi:hypothetical protein
MDSVHCPALERRVIRTRRCAANAQDGRENPAQLFGHLFTSVKQRGWITEGL